MDELNEKLREQGIEKMADVKAAYLEGDGQISVIRNPDARDQDSTAQKPESRSRSGGVSGRFGDDDIPVARPLRGQPDLLDAVFTDVARLRGCQCAEHAEDSDGYCFVP